MAQLRISNKTHEILHDLTRLEGVSMQTIVDKALAEYQKKRFFDSLDTAFDALKNDPEAWAEERQERQVWGSAPFNNV